MASIFSCWIFRCRGQRRRTDPPNQGRGTLISARKLPNCLRWIPWSLARIYRTSAFRTASSWSFLGWSRENRPRTWFYARCLFICGWESNWRPKDSFAAFLNREMGLRPESPRCQPFRGWRSIGWMCRPPVLLSLDHRRFRKNFQPTLTRRPPVALWTAAQFTFYTVVCLSIIALPNLTCSAPSSAPIISDTDTTIRTFSRPGAVIASTLNFPGVCDKNAKPDAKP